MHLRLTVLDCLRSSAPQDVAVHGSDGATVNDLWPPLAAALGHTTTLQPELYAGGSPLAATGRLGAPPLLDGAVVRIGRPAQIRALRGTGVLQLHVVAGPDCGQVIELPPGTHRIGRASDVLVRIDDSDVSRVHADLVVAGGGVTVADLGASNGTFVAGERLDSARLSLPVGTPLTVGRSTLMVRLPDAPPAAVRADGCGHVQVNRLPRLKTQPPPVEVRLPVPPARRERSRVPMLTMLLPLLLSAALAWALHSPAYLLFGLMSPMMMLGTFVSDRRHGRQGDRRSRADFRRDRALADRQLAAALRDEATDRHASAPDHALLADVAQGPLGRLWERRPTNRDWLDLRLGTGAQSAWTTLRHPDGVTTHPVLSNVPVSVSLEDAKVLGIAGVRTRVVALCRALLAQVAGWHSPDDISLWVLTAEDAQTWAWTTYLPHLLPDDGARTRFASADDAAGMDRVLNGLLALVDGSAGEAAGPGALLTARYRGTSDGRPRIAAETGRHVVLIDGISRLRARPGVRRLLECGPDAGLRFICLDDAATALPPEATATILVAADGTLRLQCPKDRSCGPVVADLVSARWVQRLARSLAPLRDGGDARTTGLPDSVRLLDLLPDDAADPAVLAARWRRGPGTMRAVLGVSHEGPYAVDLARDGPHVLLGGTTGSGKSELLQSLVASLALANRPDELAFLLVDYKGGAAFTDCAQLPHTVGLVTDLDAQLTERALTSLRAELKRRERLFGSVSASGIADYARLRGANDPVLPRLVLVVDEFRMLAEELPQFVAGLVAVASVGRSLGVHLVLATQRPGGIVSADIRANVNLRIALRVRDQVDSLDVVEIPDAAALSAHQPGRGYLRAGGGAPVLLQCARVAGGAPSAGTTAEVTVSRWESPSDSAAQARSMALQRAKARTPRSGPGRRPEPVDSAASISASLDADQAPSDLMTVVSATLEAARICGIPQASSPWLPPLPTVVRLSDLPAVPHWHIPYALADQPAQQAQPTLAWDLAGGGHLGIAGTSRSGCTTVLRTLAGAAVGRFSPSEVHLHVLDGSGGLASMADLPHAGVVAGRDEPARIERLLYRLEAELGDRRALFAAEGYASLVEQRAGAAARVAAAPEAADGFPATPALPYLVLFVHGWQTLAAVLEQVDHGRALERLLRVLSDGPNLGLRAVVTGDRTVLLSRLTSLLPERLVLRMADPTDMLLVGVPTAAVPAELPAGRGVRTSDASSFQIAVLDGDLSGQAQSASLSRQSRLGGPGREALPPAQRPIRIEALPARLRLADLPPIAGHRAGTWALIGVGGDDLTPVGLDLAEHGGGLLVAGPAGSGRSTTLVTIAESLAAGGLAVVLVTPRRSPLREMSGRTGVLGCLTGDEGDRLRALWARNRALVAVADDAELLLDSAVEDVLVAMARAGDSTGGGVVCAGTSVELTATYRGITTEVRRRRAGVLLNATDYADGEVFGVRTPHGGALLPGRGLLVDGSRMMPIQVALPH